MIKHMIIMKPATKYVIFLYMLYAKNPRIPIEIGTRGLF